MVSDSYKKKLKDHIQKIKIYNKIANIGQISRRYIALNGFDGVITIIGVLLGSFIIGSKDYEHVIIAGAAVCISLTVSGVWSAYNSETAERTKEIQDLEKSTLHVLDGTIISRAQDYASVVLAAVNGLSSGLTAFIPLIPFFFGGRLPIDFCYYIGAALAFAILIGIGLFLGRISKRNLIISVIKMVLAGVFCIGLGFLLELI
jgi:predicted membrane protein (TIGR00267 family)